MEKQKLNLHNPTVMPIKAATNYLATSNDDGRKQTIKTNLGSSRDTAT